VATYANIGIIYEQYKDYDNAIEYYRRAAETAEKTGLAADSAYASLNWGYIHYLNKEYDSGEQEYLKSLAYYQSIGLPLREAETLFYLGKLHLAEKNYEAAVSYYQASLDLYEKMGTKLDLPSMYVSIGNVYYDGENFLEAQKYFKKAEALALEIDSREDLTLIYDCLSSNYEALGDYEKAYAAQKLYREFNDTVYNKETKEQINQLEMNYELRVQQAENLRLLSEQEKNTTILRQRTLVAIGGWVIVLLAVGFALVYYRSNKKVIELNQKLERKVEERTAELKAANEELKMANKELERFTYIASHDLKEPLRNISSFISLIHRKVKEKADPKLNEYMEYVLFNTKHLYNLVEDILAFSRIKDLDPNSIKEVSLEAVVQDIENNLLQQIKEKKAQIQVGELPVLKAHRTDIFVLLKNLVENGLKYNLSEMPVVRISGVQQEKGMLIKVADNGIGIAPEYQEKVFGMFTRLHNRGEFSGAGIGLSTCQKIVQKYRGRIWIESEDGKGSIFHVFIPHMDVTDYHTEKAVQTPEITV
jgi:signal transduction histidine kinase